MFALKNLWWLVRLSFPLSLAGFLLLAAFGHFKPWSAADRALEAHGDRAAVLVGFSYRARHSTAGSIRTVSGSYLLLPSASHKATIVTVQQTNGAATVVTESRVQLVVVVFLFGASILGTWWFWLRSGSAQQRAAADVRNARG